MSKKLKLYKKESNKEYTKKHTTIDDKIKIFEEFLKTGEKLDGSTVYKGYRIGHWAIYIRYALNRKKQEKDDFQFTEPTEEQLEKLKELGILDRRIDSKVDEKIEFLTEWNKKYRFLNSSINLANIKEEGADKELIEQYENELKELLEDEGKYNKYYEYVRERYSRKKLTEEQIDNCKEANLGGVLGYSKETEKIAEKSNISVRNVNDLLNQYGSIEIIYDLYKTGKIDNDVIKRLFITVIDIDGENNKGYTKLISELRPSSTPVLYSSSLLKNSILELKEREQIVLERRLEVPGDGKPKDLESISQDIGVTRERIRQVEATAYRKIKYRLDRREIIYPLERVKYSDYLTDKEKDELAIVEKEIDRICMRDENVDSKYCFDFLSSIKEKINQREKRGIIVSEEYKQGILNGDIHIEDLISYTYEDFIDIGIDEEKANELVSNINEYINNYGGILKKEIEELNLTPRAYNCLKRAGINTVVELIKLTEEELSSIRNLGMRSFEEIKNAVNALGLSFGISKVDDDLNELLNIDIDELGLSVRAYNALARGGIRNVQAIITMTEEELASIRNLGTNSFNEIKAKMEDLGLHLKTGTLEKEPVNTIRENPINRGQEVNENYIYKKDIDENALLDDEDVKRELVKKILEKQKIITEQEKEISELKHQIKEL